MDEEQIIRCARCSNDFSPMIDGDTNTCAICIEKEIEIKVRCSECFSKSMTLDPIGLCVPCANDKSKQNPKRKKFEADEKFYHSVKFNKTRMGRFSKS